MSSGKKKAHPGAGTPKRAKLEAGTGQATTSGIDSITNAPAWQAGTVSKILLPGVENAIPGHELTKLLGLKNVRALTQLIERERLAGIPICAAVSGGSRGYYLPATPEELNGYLGSFNRRVRNMTRTKDRLTDTLGRMTGQNRMTGW